MTTFAGLSLRRDDGSPGCGAAFVVRAPAYASRTVRYNDWVIDVIQGTKIVVARGSPATTANDRVVEDGLAAANVGLDFMCFVSSERLLIDKYAEEHLSWWPNSKSTGLTVAATAVQVLEFGMSATVTVSDAQGRVVPPAPPTHPEWHASYRYFRVSQTTTDLHDAYRNAFLALESLLDHLQPQRHESESAWFARAMSAADGMIGLAAQLFPNNPDPVTAVVDEFYRQWRTAVAHSKASRRFVLPHDAQDRLDLINSLGRLTSYYMALAEHVFHTRRAATHFTKAAFEGMAKSFAEYEVYASDDGSPLDTTDSQLAPSGGALAAMAPAGDIELPEPFLAQRVWASQAIDVEALTAVRRIVGAKDGKAGFVLVLEADLVLDNGDQLEARFAWSTISRTDLRSRYAT